MCPQIVVVGDSLARHVAQALMMTTIGNLTRGGVRHWLLPPGTDCDHELQFADHDLNGCRAHALLNTDDLNDELKQTYCTGHKVRITMRVLMTIAM